MKITLERHGNRIHLTSPFRQDIPGRAKSVSGYSWADSYKAWTYPLDYEICRLLRAEFGKELEIGPRLWDWAAQWKGRLYRLQEIVKAEPYPPFPGVQGARELSGLNGNAKASRAYTRERNQQSMKKPLERVKVSCGEGEGRYSLDSSKLFTAISNRPYQWTAVNYILAARTALIADQPGLGKTLETLAALVADGTYGKVLVAAPSTSCLATWQPEIERWLEWHDDSYTITQLAGKTKLKREVELEDYKAMPERAGRIDFLIVNPEMVRYWNAGSSKNKPYKLFDIQFSAIIGDETHRFLVNTSGANASRVGTGFGKLKLKPNGLKIALSGTPLKGKAQNVWGTLNWLRPDVYTTRWGWIGRYFDMEENGFGSTILGLKKNSEAAFHRELDGFMLRRTKEEIRKLNPAWMPPEKRYNDVWVELESKQRTAYNAMAKMAEAELEGGTLSAVGVLAEFTRMKQLAASHGRLETRQRKVRNPYFNKPSEYEEFFRDAMLKPEHLKEAKSWYNPKNRYQIGTNGEPLMEDYQHLVPQLPSAKFDWLVEFLEERGIARDLATDQDEIRKVVVASQFTSLIDIWSAELNRLGIKTFKLTGDTADRHRAQYQKLFQDPKQTETRVFLINTNAGGVSITLDAADDVVIMDETWVPDEQEQVEDRVHRASNVAHQVDVWYVRARETIEEYIAQQVGTKAYTNHVALDSQRGLAFARSKGWEPPKGEDK